MNEKRPPHVVTSVRQREALASPLRLEIVGLFGETRLLSIADMAARMGVRASSLYHHVSILEHVGLLQRAGTRRKGKRDEALFEAVHGVLELAIDSADADAKAQVLRTVVAALRMAERDLAHALERPDVCTEGAARNLLATRAHLRASPRVLARINRHIDAIIDLLSSDDARSAKGREQEASDAQHISLTLALSPMKGRGRN